MILKPFKHIAVFLFLLVNTILANARVTLPAIISSGMVLQQNTNAGLWGEAAPGKMVRVITSWNQKMYSVVADKQGEWGVKVATPSYGGPYKITISDGDILTLENVLIGEVWVCSGQSNMEMPLAGWGKINNFQQEIEKANYPFIRLLQAEHITCNTTLKQAVIIHGGWTPCTPQYVAAFSSVAYFFAREIFTRTHIPVGLIHTSWGGTIAEAWTSVATLSKMDDFKKAVAQIVANNTDTMMHAYGKQLSAWQESIENGDAGNKDGTFAWAAKDINIADWQQMELPNKWESAGLPDLNGFVWFRKKVIIPASMAGKQLILSLGKVDDNDITWWNGEKMGETGGYNKTRQYVVAGSHVKVGENEIVVRVFDNYGDGGIYDHKDSLYLAFNNGEKMDLAGKWLYKSGLNLKDLPGKPEDITGPNRPAVLYNAMIHPFIRYSIRGAIWYQGESNADRAFQYRSLFPALIKDWRMQWKQGDFPFYFVQLANYMTRTDQPVESDWAELREAQFQTLSVPNTGMAVTIDIGEADDIHPKNKQEVGRRLALIALAKNYGKSITYSGPLYQSFLVAGAKILVNFTQVNGGLQVGDGTALRGFEIAGADKKFYKATAVIKKNQVIVSSAEVDKPMAVRYNWANNPNGNLYNQSRLPASPFRTDTWRGLTAGNH